MLTFDIRYQGYLNNVSRLTRSIMLYIGDEAKAFNQSLLDKGYSVDYKDFKSWRYIRHLAGLKHPSDDVLKIKSLDTLEEIVFDRESMSIHTRTKKELAKQGSYYEDFVALYPEYDLYIRAVLYDSTFGPDMYESIEDIKELTIVGYDATLIEDQELDLIHELQSYLYNYEVKRFVTNYSLTDDLFLPAAIHILYLFIFKTILQIRLNKAKTSQAHSFHIQEFLGSRHRLDRFLRYLSFEQIYYLYRNTLYFDNHSGSNFTFKELVEHLFTRSFIDTNIYVKHSSLKHDEDLRIESFFNKKYLSNKRDSLQYGLDYITAKEINLVRDNLLDIKSHMKNMQEAFKYQLHNTINTKEVEINFTDYTDSVPVTILEIILKYFLANVYLERVTQYSYIQNYNNTQEYVLSPLDTARLLIATLYLINGTAYDKVRENIFTARLMHVQKPWKYDKEAFYGLMGYYSIEDKKLTGDVIDYHRDYPYMLRSSSETLTYMKDKYIDHLTDWLFISNIHSLKRDSYFKNVIKNIYYDMEVDFNNGENIEEFAYRTGMKEILEYDKDKLETLLYNILNSIFDDKLDLFYALKYKVRNLVNIFKVFKSYTTLIIGGEDFVSFTPGSSIAVKFDHKLLFEVYKPYDYLLKFGISHTDSLELIDDVFNIPSLDIEFSHKSIDLVYEIDITLNMYNSEVQQLDMSTRNIHKLHIVTDIEPPLEPDQNLLTFLAFNPPSA